MTDATIAIDLPLEKQTCKNCGNEFSGNYCNLCGEKVFVERNKAIAHYFDDSIHFLAHIDSKFFKSLWLVFTRPAYISNDICNGIQKKYFKPLNLFLIGVVIYLLFPFFQGLNMPLKGYLQEPYGSYAKWLIRTKMAAHHISAEAVAAQFNEKSHNFAKVLLLVTIPLSGLALAALFRRKRAYYYDHLTLAAELNTFSLYFNFFLLPLAYIIFVFLAKLFTGKTGFDIDDSIAVPVYVLVFGTYCTIAFTRFYNEKKGWAILKSVLFLASIFAVSLIYRFILLSVVFLFI